MSLPTEAQARKDVPITSGCLDYFPDALAAVAGASMMGAKQHNGGKLFWDRTKSTDESDALMRHFMERGTVDTDGIRHSTKVAWRALALLQKEIEAAAKPKPLYDPVVGAQQQALDAMTKKRDFFGTRFEEENDRNRN